MAQETPAPTTPTPENFKNEYTFGLSPEMIEFQLKRDAEAAARQFEYDKQYSRILLDQQKEQAAEAAKYKAMFDLPENIASAITFPAALAVQGQSDIAGMMLNQIGNIPRAEIPSATQRSPQQYTTAAPKYSTRGFGGY